jgi:hypothetical protein
LKKQKYKIKGKLDPPLSFSLLSYLTLLPLATIAKQENHFPPKIWYHNAPRVAYEETFNLLEGWPFSREFAQVH